MSGSHDIRKKGKACRFKHNRMSIPVFLLLSHAEIVSQHESVRLPFQTKFARSLLKRFMPACITATDVVFFH